MSVPASGELKRHLPPSADPWELSAPELALRLLEDLDDGGQLYVAEHEARIAGFAQVTGLMVGDGGHLVELSRLYVVPELRRQGMGRELLALVLQDLAQRPSPPSLRAWASCGSEASRFLELAGATATRQRWKVGAGDIAVRGVVYGWAVRQGATVGDRALAT